MKVKQTDLSSKLHMRYGKIKGVEVFERITKNGVIIHSLRWASLGLEEMTE